MKTGLKRLGTEGLGHLGTATARGDLYISSPWIPGAERRESLDGTVASVVRAIRASRTHDHDAAAGDVEAKVLECSASHVQPCPTPSKRAQREDGYEAFTGFGVRFADQPELSVAFNVLHLEVD